MYIGSFIIYMAIMLLAMHFAGKAEVYTNHRGKYLRWSFLIVFLFCALRFYVGNDYANYVEIFYFMQEDYNPAKTEPAFYILSYPFFKIRAGYLYVFALCSFISNIFIYKTLERENSLRYGVFVLFTLEFLIFCNNGIRQGVAMSIVIYALEYARKKDYLKYIFFVALATTFHYTACVMLIFLLVPNKININKIFYYILVIVALLLYISGRLTPLIVQAIGLTPFYGEYYSVMHLNQFDIVQTSTGLGLIFKVILILFAINKIDTIEDKYYVHIFILGSIMRICVTGFMLPERISLYLVFVNIIGFAKLLEANKSDIIGKAMIGIIVLYYSLQSLFALESHGAIPYRTLFFENLDRIHYEYVDDE